MTAQELLQVMDAKAQLYEFPVLDNANWDYAAGRIRGVRSAGRIAVVFELLIFQPGSSQFLVDTYAFGDLLKTPGGYVGSSTLLTEVDDQPLWDEDGMWIPGASTRAIVVHGIKVIATAPDVVPALHDGDVHVRLSAGDDRSEGDFARALARELGMRTLVPDGQVAELIPELAQAQEVARLSCWQHPNIAQGELPSSSHALRELAEFLSGERPTLAHDHTGDNSDRRAWTA